MKIRSAFDRIIEILDRDLTRSELRRIAKDLGVKQGRDKWDTIRNLANSGKLEVELKIK